MNKSEFEQEVEWADNERKSALMKDKAQFLLYKEGLKKGRKMTLKEVFDKLNSLNCIGEQCTGNDEYGIDLCILHEQIVSLEVEFRGDSFIKELKELEN